MWGGIGKAVIGSAVALVVAVQSSVAVASCMTAAELRAEKRSLSFQNA